MLGLHAALDEFVAEMDRMRHARRENHSLASRLRVMLVPGRHDVCDEPAVIHDLLELAVDVIALPGVNPLQVRNERDKDSSPHEEAEPDQFLDLRDLDENIKGSAEAAPVSAA